MNTQTTPRQQALAAIVRLHGPHAVQPFMRTRQPCFDDMTGSEILQQRPDELLRRLEMLEEARELETLVKEGGEHDD